MTGSRAAISTAIGTPPALNLLRELAIAAGDAFQSIATEWIDAIATHGSAESKEILLSFADPDIAQMGLEQYLQYYHRERLASCILSIARSVRAVKDRLYALCARQPQGTKRLLLAGIVARFGTGEALTAGLDLFTITPHQQYPMSYCEGSRTCSLIGQVRTLLDNLTADALAVGRTAGRTRSA